MSITETSTNKEQTMRRCGLAPKNANDKYDCTSPPDGNTPVCSICKTDLCNSAPAVQFSMIAVSGMVLAAFLPKFLL